jgi:hypothetical protein
MCLGEAGALLYGRAEPAPPRGKLSKARWPCGGRPGDRAMGGFLGGTHSVRPRGKAGRKPGRLMITDGRAKGWWPKRDNISVGVMSTLRACGARPSGGPIWPEKPSGERPRGCFRLLTGEEGFRPRQTKGPSGSRLLLEEGNLMGAGLNETSFKGPFGGRCEEFGRVPSRLPLP